MTKKLYRSEKDKIVAGVCGGLGDYFDLDPTIIRIIFVILTIWGGVGILLYIIGIIVMPPNPDQVRSSKDDIKENVKKSAQTFAQDLRQAAEDLKEPVKNDRKRLSRDQVLGLIILLLGLMFLFRNFFNWFNLHDYWPIILVVIGILLLLGGARKGKK